MDAIKYIRTVQQFEFKYKLFHLRRAEIIYVK